MVFCTIATKSRLAHVRALFASLRAVHPKAELYVLLADRPDGFFDPAAEPYKIILLPDLNRNALIERMAFYYTPFEFCCALRGLLHDYLYNNITADRWVFLDADIYVFHPLDDIFAALDDASILLNPHNTRPAADEFFPGTEFQQLQSGIFNAGFLGLRRCDQSRDFIAWFSHRLERFCLTGAPGLFVDQLWLNHVPQFFTDAKSYTHPGANLAHWNLYQHALTRTADGQFQSDEKPLLFFHFSGWEIDKPTHVCRVAPIYEQLNLPQSKAFGPIGELYRFALLRHGYDQVIKWPYAFTHFADGSPITVQMRRRYYQQLWSGKAGEISPFQRVGPMSEARKPGP